MIQVKKTQYRVQGVLQQTVRDNIAVSKTNTNTGMADTDKDHSAIDKVPRDFK